MGCVGIQIQCVCDERGRLKCVSGRDIKSNDSDSKILS